MDLITHPDCEKVAYADDLVVLIPGDTPADITSKSEAITTQISDTLSAKSLHLEPLKAEMSVLSGTKRLAKRAVAKVCGLRIKAQPSTRYLGVLADKNLSFKSHVRFACEKASKVARSFASILPNTRGPAFKKRKLILSAAYSSLFYALPTWYQVTKIQTYSNLITKTCRPSKNVACAALTVLSQIIY